MDNERRDEDRRDTDRSLRDEREATDRLLDEQGPARVIDMVRDRRGDATRRLNEARERVDAQRDQQLDVSPEVSEKLGEVVESLTKAAESLTGVADTLKGALAPGALAGHAGEAADGPQPMAIAANMAEVAEQLVDTAGRVTSRDAVRNGSPNPDASGMLAEQLAEIAGGMAEMTAALAEERRDVDDTVHHEREVTDRIVGQELDEVGAAVAEELLEEQDVLREERAATDATLMRERVHTDEAVDRVLTLLADGDHERAVAERTIATRNEFLRIVSHDLRGPLMAISGLTGLIAHEAPAGESGEKIRGWIDGVKRSVSVMERLIRDLLDFGSFEDGQLRVAAAPLDIRALIARTVEVFEPVAASRFITLEANVPSQPVVAMYDDHRVFQVLSNLIHNALKFTRGGGSIRVGAVVRETDCLVSVADTGIGIPAHELSAIFERFRQLDAESDRTGLGLGLYISLWIVEAHGGRIWAESEVGAGTTFYFTLPLPAEQPAAL